MSKAQLFVVGESLKQLWKVMMLQSYYAVFANSILSSVSFHCFLAHVELEKELFAAWNQVPWPCKGRSKTTTVVIQLGVPVHLSDLVSLQLNLA